MGFFGKLKETIKDIQISEELKSKMVSKEMAADANRPSIRSLPYKQLITSVADDPRLMEPKKVNKKQREQFIECIRQGRFSYTEVVIVDTCNHIIRAFGSGKSVNRFGVHRSLQSFFGVIAVQIDHRVPALLKDPKLGFQIILFIRMLDRA